MSPGIILIWVVGLLLVAAPWISRKLVLGAVVLSWLGLVGGVGLGIWGQYLTVIDAIALAGLGSTAVASWTDAGWKRISLTLGGTTLALALGTSMADSPNQSGAHLEVILGCWAAFWATFGVLVSLLARSERFAGGMALASGLSAGAVAVMVTSRSSLGGWGYYLFLRGAEGPLYWELPGMEQLPGGLRFAVALSLPPWIFGALVLASVIGVVLAVAGPVLPKKAALVGFGLGAALLITAAMGPSQANTGGMPDAQPYEDSARQALARVNADPQFVAQGGFNSAVVSVDQARRTPDIALLLMGALWALMGLLVSLGRLPLEVRELEAQESDTTLAVKAVGFVWLGWLMSGLAHLNFVGTSGMRSPSEWWMTGMALLATGAIVATINAGKTPRTLVYGGIVGLLVWFAALNVTFGSYPGLSIGMF